MIVPIGNTASIRRLPYATILLIFVLCAVFFAMQPSVRRGDAEFYRCYGEYINLVAVNMENKGMDSFDSEALAAEMKNPSVFEEDSLFNFISEAKRNFEKASKNHPFTKFGVSRNNISFVTLFTSMFIHSDVFHLIGNLWFLFLLGFNIEDIYGRINYLVFFILSGIFSSFLFVASASDPSISLIGASGAISGVMGAFLVKLYKTKIKFFYWFFPVKPLFGTFLIYAGFCLPLWFMQQIFESASNLTSGIAFIAHIGGFLFGALTAMLLIATKIEERFISPKVEEASNLLGMNKEEQEGVEAYLEHEYTKALTLLSSNFDRKRTFSVFIPLFASLVKTNELSKAQKTMDVYLNELKSKGMKTKIKEIYSDLKDEGLFENASSSSKVIFAITLKELGENEESRIALRRAIEQEKYTVFGYKTLLTAYRQEMHFEGINEIAKEFIDKGSDEMSELKQKLARSINE
ncbi:MAG: rhomboid family intramembrane serine protease [bacterium]|nr:rhomboid family intramembrane serine protease [bacterium]